MSLMPLSLCKKLKLLDLKPTNTLILLAYCSVGQFVGILEDMPVRVGKFVVQCDFIVMDLDANSQVPLILGRSFLATAGAVIDVQTDTLSFQLCEDMMDFSFPCPAPPSTPVLPSPSEAPIHSSPFDAVLGIEIFDGNGGPHAPLRGSYTFFAAVLSRFATTVACTGEVDDPTSHFYNSPRSPSTW